MGRREQAGTMQSPSCSRQYAPVLAAPCSSQTPVACTRSSWCTCGAQAVGASDQVSFAPREETNCTYCAAELRRAVRTLSDDAQCRAGAAVFVLAALLGRHGSGGSGGYRELVRSRSCNGEQACTHGLGGGGGAEGRVESEGVWAGGLNTQRSQGSGVAADKRG
jgi:hypothetical protein